MEISRIYLRERMDSTQIAKAHENHAEIIEALKEEYGVEIEDVASQKHLDNITEKKSQSTVNSGPPPETKEILTAQNKDDRKEAPPVKQMMLTEQNKDVEKEAAPPVKQNASTDKNKDTKNEVLNVLKEQIESVTMQLENNLSISQAKRFALKKTLAMHRSKLIREERRLKEESS